MAANLPLLSTGANQLTFRFCPILQDTCPSAIPSYNANTTAGTAGLHDVTTSADFTNIIGGTLSVTALVAALPVGTKLYFDNGLLVEVVTAAAATDTSVDVVVIDKTVNTEILLPSGSISKVIEVTALTAPIPTATVLRWDNNAVSDVAGDAIVGSTIITVTPYAPGITTAVPAAAVATYGNGVDSPLEELKVTTNDLPFAKTINNTTSLLHPDASQSERNTPTSQSNSISVESLTNVDDHAMRTIENLFKVEVQRNLRVYGVYSAKLSYLEAIITPSNFNLSSTTGDLVNKTFDLAFDGRPLRELNRRATWAVA